MNKQPITDLGDIMLACALEFIAINKDSSIAVPSDILADLLQRRLLTYNDQGEFTITRLGDRFQERIAHAISAGDVTLQGPEAPLVPDFLPDELA